MERHKQFPATEKTEHVRLVVLITPVIRSLAMMTSEIIRTRAFKERLTNNTEG